MRASLALALLGAVAVPATSTAIPTGDRPYRRRSARA